jgi:hypothetical protein
MSTVTSRPLSLSRVDFADLYARHLCRHSQFGINVAHLAALFGVWFGVYGVVLWVARHLEASAQFPVEWLAVALAVGYLMLVALNAPARVCVATAVFLVPFVAAVVFVPPLPVWAYALMVPVCYELQSLSHKVWTASADMTEFNKRFPKGNVLFVILLVYEVPLLLNYLVFDRKSWTA